MIKCCDNCLHNSYCKKPYESEEEYQLQNLGRTYTKEEWYKERYCGYWKSKAKEDEQWNVAISQIFGMIQIKIKTFVKIVKQDG